MRAPELQRVAFGTRCWSYSWRAANTQVVLGTVVTVGDVVEAVTVVEVDKLLPVVPVMTRVSSLMKLKGIADEVGLLASCAVYTQMVSSPRSEEAYSALVSLVAESEVTPMTRGIYLISSSQT